MVVAFLSGYFSTALAKAASSDGYFYYLIPPASSVSVNAVDIENDDQEMGKMMFRKENPEKLIIPLATQGFKVVSRNFSTEVKPESQLSISANIMSLGAGSVHITSLKSVTGMQSFHMGNLSVTFQSADFLAFVSGDQSQKIIKVLEGEVVIENPSTKQQATLKSHQMTSIDSSGKLLMPFPFEMAEGSGWWEAKEFDFTFDMLPIANAGDDQRVLGNIPVALDGTASEFITGDIFEWELLKGPVGPDGQEVTGVAFNSTYIQKPLFTPVVDGEYHFSLRITDSEGRTSNTDEVTIFVGKSFLTPLAIFPDVPADHPNNLAITFLYKKNVMKGSEDPKTGQILFRPEDTINRVEILKAIFENKRQKIPTIEELKLLTAEDLFLDVKIEHWFAPYVYLAKKMGIVKGNDGLYRPADKVLLVEALKMLVEVNQTSLEPFLHAKEKPYPDAEEDAWYSPYLFFAKAYNLVDVDALGHINPGQPLTRAKFAEIVYRMESINLLEKRSVLNGILKDSKTKAGIGDGEIYIFHVIEEPDAASEENGFVEKGDLYFKTTTGQDGSFSVSLPINTKYYIEALSGDNVSTTRLVVELKENVATNVELELVDD